MTGLGEPVQAFFAAQPFQPDPFQREAVAVIESGESVVVTAPTGSGKTLIAEAAVHLTLERGDRAFYTTPIKALSNQKYGDFCAVYGVDRVGLLTGDNVINGDAPVVVMTTEVLRNMIYADSPALHDLGVVVLDEVHYLQDRYRGSVWEEVIIHLPQRVQLVSLSATVANAEEFAGWMRTRRGPTSLIIEDHRPVPLESLYLIKDRHREQRLVMLPVFGKDGAKPNSQVTRLLRKGRGRFRRFATPRRLEVVEELLGEGLLPAIYFIFSRAGCDQAAEIVAQGRLELTTAEEATEIRRIASERTSHLPAEDLGVLGYASWLSTLEKGAAAHHAGMVPAFKETVEELFSAGLLKVVFATETLALGINMPARTVVLERLTKWTGESHEMLQPGDFTQLTGRAGRRGIDTQGTAVVLHSPHIPFEQVASIAAAGSHPLRSSFQPSYNMAANLVSKYPRDEAEELLNASFAQYHAERRRRELEEALTRLQAEHDEARRAAACDRGDLWAFLEEQGSGRDTQSLLNDFVQRTHAGDVFRFADDEQNLWVLLVRGYGARPRMLLLSAEGELHRFRPDELPATIARVGAMDLPDPFRPRDTAYQRQVVRRLRQWHPAAEGEPVRIYPEMEAADPVARCPQLPEHRRWAQRATKLEQRIARTQRRLQRPSSSLVAHFRSVLGLLESWGYVDGWSLTDRGERLRFVYNEMDLVVAEAVERGELGGLRPPELAGLASLFTYEARAADVSGDWPSPVTAERGERIVAIGEQLAAAEEERGLPITRGPDSGFAEAAFYWASGVDLEDLFDDDFAAGDFVRNCRQLLDLLRQLRDVFPDLRSTAAAAIEAVDRGVVAAGGRL